MKIRNSIRISIVLLTILSSTVAADCDSEGSVLPDSRTPEEIAAEERENFLQARSKVQMSKVRFVGTHQVSVTSPLPSLSGEEVCGWVQQCLYEFQVIDRGNNLRVQDGNNILLIYDRYVLDNNCQIPNDQVREDFARYRYISYYDYTNRVITTDKDDVISGEWFGGTSPPTGMLEDEYLKLLHESASDVAKDRKNRQERDYLDTGSCIPPEEPTPQP